VYNYRITDVGISIVFFGTIPVMRIYFTDIIQIKKLSYIELLPFNKKTNHGALSALKFGNRLWGETVLIRKYKGLFFKTIVITPDHADNFISEVMRHIGKKPIIV